MQDDSFTQDVEVELELEIGGELLYLKTSLEEPEEEDTMCTEDTDKSRAPSLNVEQSYGNPLSQEEALTTVPSGSDGLIRYAIVIPDDFCVEGKLMSGLNPRDFNVEKGVIKPRRATLPLTKSNLMSSLTMVVSDGGPRYIFNGVLNGWPSLRNFELIGLEKKRCLPGGVQAPEFVMNSIGKAWVPHWRAGKGTPPEMTDRGIYRATLRGAPWTSQGWSPSSKGFVFWFEAQRPEGPRVLYGSDAISQLGDDVCKTVHMISHRVSVSTFFGLCSLFVLALF